VVKLRPATEADAARLFAWRRDPETVTASIDPPPQTWDDHMKWFDAILAQEVEDVDVFIATDTERSVTVGVLRLDYSADASAATGLAEVSITVDPAQRGRGYAFELLTTLLADKATVPTLVAMVKDTNYASLRLFWAAGFRDSAVSDGVLRLEKSWS
jgi:UDP-2,4-diacetamido-2,4,6-trideoxy-beta-L-altropyranose hydrolase